MKTVTRRIIAILILLPLVVIGCKPNPSEKLINKWKPVDATGDSVTPEVKAGIVKDGNTMEFRKDGRFISFSAGQSPDTGTYKLNDDGKMVIIQSANQRQIKLHIMELKANRMIIENQGVVMVMEPLR